MKLLRLQSFKPFHLISGAVVVLATILFYFLLLEATTPIFGLSLAFVILAEVILFLIAAFGAMSIVRAAYISVSVFHLLLTIVLSLVYFQFEFSVKSFILWNILLLAAVYLVDAYLMYSFRKFRVKDESTYRARSVVQQCAALAQNIVDQNSGSPYVRQLKQIQEDLRFSDNSAITGLEDRIYDLLDQLQRMLEDDEADQVAPQIERIRQALSERTQQIKQIKTGRF